MKKNERNFNRYDLNEKYGIGWTSNTNEEFYFDLEDYNLIKKYYWRLDKTGGYVCTNIEHAKMLAMHKLITNTDKRTIIDHKNRNKLDNRKENLRFATNQQNAFNSSISKNNTSDVSGVCFDKSRNKWYTRIMINRKSIYLGRFVIKEEAINARLKAELKYFGEFSPNYNSLIEKENK